MIRFYPITPVPAPRQVRRDKWDPSPSVVRYREFRDMVRLLKVDIPEKYYHVVFILPMPASWSKKRRELTFLSPHKQRPDRDNLEKALLDAVFGDDSHIYDGRTTKLWGNDGGIFISNTDIVNIWDIVKTDGAGYRLPVH